MTDDELRRRVCELVPDELGPALVAALRVQLARSLLADEALHAVRVEALRAIQAATKDVAR